MSIGSNIRDIWSPVTKYTSKISCTCSPHSVRRITKTFSLTVWFSLLFIIRFFYYAMVKPVRMPISRKN